MWFCVVATYSISALCLPSINLKISDCRPSLPSINVELSGTRKEELLYHPDEYGKVVLLRKALTGVPAVEAMELLLSKLRQTGTNIEFLLSVSNA